MNKHFEFFSTLKTDLNDAPKEVKQAYNELVNFFDTSGKGKGKSEDRWVVVVNATDKSNKGESDFPQVYEGAGANNLKSKEDALQFIKENKEKLEKRYSNFSSVSFTAEKDLN